MHVLLEVSSAQPSVPVVGNVSAVHDLAEQVTEVLPRHLGVGLQVVVEHVDADGQVAHVVRVHPVPALRSELTSLRHDGVEVTQREEDRLELVLPRAHLKRVLHRGQ